MPQSLQPTEGSGELQTQTHTHHSVTHFFRRIYISTLSILPALFPPSPSCFLSFSPSPLLLSPLFLLLPPSLPSPPSPSPPSPSLPSPSLSSLPSLPPLSSLPPLPSPLLPSPLSLLSLPIPSSLRVAIQDQVKLSTGSMFCSRMETIGATRLAGKDCGDRVRAWEKTGRGSKLSKNHFRRRERSG